MILKIIILIVIIVAILIAVLRVTAKRHPASGIVVNGDLTRLQKAFTQGAVANDGTNGNITFEIRDLGILHITTGKIVACDPFVFMGGAYTRPVPNGSFPVQIAIAKIETDDRIAFARICFSDSVATRWEMAVVPGSDIKSLKADEIFGYGVDSGTGAFMDAKAFEQLQKKDEAYSDALMAEMDKTYKSTRSWAVADLGDTNAILFSSGYGDGVYASYWGFDANDNLVSLTTDFAVVDIIE